MQGSEESHWADPQDGTSEKEEPDAHPDDEPTEDLNEPASECEESDQTHYHNAIVKSPVIDGQDDHVWASEETMYDRKVEQDSQGSYRMRWKGV